MHDIRKHANPSPKWVPSLAAQNTGLHNHTNPAKGVALNCSVHRTSPQFISYENRSTGIYTYDYDLDLTV